MRNLFATTFIWSILLVANSFAQSTTFTLWNWLPDYEKTFWELAVTEYNNAHSDSPVKLNYEQVGYLEMRPTLNSGFASGKVPDIQSIEFNQWSGYMSDGPSQYFHSLNSIIDSEKANLSEAHLAEFKNGADKYAVSFQASPLIVLYRSDIISPEKADKIFGSWNDFAVAYDEMKADGKNYIGFDIFDFQNFNGLFLQHGGKFPTKQQSEFSPESDMIFQETATYLKTLSESGPNRFSISVFVEGGLDEDVKSGHLAAMVVGDWAIPILKERFPDMKGKWKVHALPTWNSGFKGVAVGGTGYAVVKNPKRSSADTKKLMDFLQFSVYSLKMQSIYYKNFSLQMSNLQLANNKAAILFTDPYFGNQKLALDLREQIKDMAPRPVDLSLSKVSTKFEEISPSFYQGQISVQELISQIKKVIQ